MKTCLSITRSILIILLLLAILQLLWPVGAQSSPNYNGDCPACGDHQMSLRAKDTGECGCFAIELPGGILEEECPDGEEFNSLTRKCEHIEIQPVDLCDDDEVLDYLTQTCKPKIPPQVCQDNQKFNPNTNKCEPIEPAPAKANPVNIVPKLVAKQVKVPDFCGATSMELPVYVFCFTLDMSNWDSNNPVYKLKAQTALDNRVEFPFYQKTIESEAVQKYKYTAVREVYVSMPVLNPNQKLEIQYWGWLVKRDAKDITFDLTVSYATDPESSPKVRYQRSIPAWITI